METTNDGLNLCNHLILREYNFRQNQKTCHIDMFRNRLRFAENLYQKDISGHYGCVNALEFSNDGHFLASGGDDKRVLVWNLEKSIANIGEPRFLGTEHSSNIFCLSFDNYNRKIFSGGNDDVVIMHDFETGKAVNVYPHDNPIYGLSVDKTTDNYLATATEDGQLLIYDFRVDSTDPIEIAKFKSSFNAVEFHPLNGNFLVTANSKRGAALWDIRNTTNPVIQYSYVAESPSCMSVRFNANGSLILALRRRLPPILYNTKSSDPICTFFHNDYYNSCTMKSCTFAGPDDELVLSGSDDFNLYVWRVSDVDLDITEQWVESTQMVLSGHRSIVNQVRYNRQQCLIASSGVEKIIKLWSPFAQKDWCGSLTNKTSLQQKSRELYSPYNWSQMSHDYSSRSTNEDPQMMAFFDSLIQQELEGWETDSSSSSSSSSDSHSDPGSVSSNSSETASNGTETTVSETTVSPSSTSSIRRRNSVQSVNSDSSWRAYPNRIAYLIARKHKTLLRLAIKSASSNDRLPRKVMVKIPIHRNGTRKVNLHTTKAAVNRNGTTSTIHNNSDSNSSGDDIATTSTAASTLISSDNNTTGNSETDNDTEVGDGSDIDATSVVSHNQEFSSSTNTTCLSSNFSEDNIIEPNHGAQEMANGGPTTNVVSAQQQQQQQQQPLQQNVRLRKRTRNSHCSNTTEAQMNVVQPQTNNNNNNNNSIDVGKFERVSNNKNNNNSNNTIDLNRTSSQAQEFLMEPSTSSSNYRNGHGNQQSSSNHTSTPSKRHRKSSNQIETNIVQNNNNNNNPYASATCNGNGIIKEKPNTRSKK